MPPTIRIDDEVYTWLQKQARPFEDTPNSVLRRIASLDAGQGCMKNEPVSKSQPSANTGKPKPINSHSLSGTVTGQKLNTSWNVGARHALYHKDGRWYNNLECFPGALFDPDGYVLFKSEAEYRNSPYLRIGKETNVPNTIASIPGYVRKPR